MDSRSIVFLIVLNLGISFAVAGIAWQAHVGGLLTGGLLTAAYAYAPRNHRTLVQVGATVAGGGRAGRRGAHPQPPTAGLKPGLSPAPRPAAKAGRVTATSWARLPPLRGQCDARDDQGEPDGEVPRL